VSSGGNCCALTGLEVKNKDKEKTKYLMWKYLGTFVLELILCYFYTSKKKEQKLLL
jgi:hypothetical protein